MQSIFWFEFWFQRKNFLKRRNAFENSYLIAVKLCRHCKNYFKKIHHLLFNNQSIKLSSSSKIDKIIQEEEVVFKKTHIVSLPEVSKLIDKVISKRQGDQRKHSFLEKKILHKRENGFTINTKKHHITWWIETMDSSISQNVFFFPI